LKLIYEVSDFTSHWRETDGLLVHTGTHTHTRSSSPRHYCSNNSIHHWL